MMENWQPSFPNDDQNCLGNKPKNSVIGSMVKIDPLSVEWLKFFGQLPKLFWAMKKNIFQLCNLTTEFFSITWLSGQSFLVIDFQRLKSWTIKKFRLLKKKWSTSILINQIDMFEWTSMWWLTHDDMSSHFYPRTKKEKKVMCKHFFKRKLSWD